jgi:prepilin-type N-terminal cleavage/methylation domain-containing protein/prepilin-type processing-associated H-X9-DG protein
MFLKPRTLRKSSGLSLVELMAVVAIIGVLLGLLLPAIQASRESSRRSRCGDNLKGYAFAVKAYEQRMAKFPPASTSNPKARHGLVPFIVGDLDGAGFGGEYDFKVSWNDAANSAAINQDIPVLICPDSPEVRQQVTDYVPAPSVSGTLFQPLIAKGYLTMRSQWLSILQPDVRLVNTASVRDGLSRSFMVFEVAGRPTMYRAGEKLGGNHEGAHWASDGSSTNIRRICNERQIVNCENIFGVYSFHPDGCNYAYGDGAVRYHTIDMSPEAWMSLFTMAAGD